MVWGHMTPDYEKLAAEWVSRSIESGHCSGFHRSRIQRDIVGFLHAADAAGYERGVRAAAEFMRGRQFPFAAHNIEAALLPGDHTIGGEKGGE